MIFRSTFHVPTSSGLEAHRGYVFIDDDKIMVRANGEMKWRQIMSTSGLSDFARNTLVEGFRQGDAAALQRDIRDALHAVNRLFKAVRSGRPGGVRLTAGARERPSGDRRR